MKPVQADYQKAKDPKDEKRMKDIDVRMKLQQRRKTTGHWRCARCGEVSKSFTRGIGLAMPRPSPPQYGRSLVTRIAGFATRRAPRWRR